MVLMSEPTHFFLLFIFLHFTTISDCPVVPRVCATPSDGNYYSEEQWRFKSTKMRISLVLGSLNHQCTLQNPVCLHELCMNCILFTLWGRERLKKDGSIAQYKCPVCALQKYAHCSMRVITPITSKCQVDNFEVLWTCTHVGHWRLSGSCSRCSPKCTRMTGRSVMTGI